MFEHGQIDTNYTHNETDFIGIWWRYIYKVIAFLYELIRSFIFHLLDFVCLFLLLVHDTSSDWNETYRWLISKHLICVLYM